MKRFDVKLSRLIRGPAGEVFDVWFDPMSPGGPWYGAKKVLMNLAVDGMFYFGVDTEMIRQHTGLSPLTQASELLGHFGRFVRIERPRIVEHTWMSEFTHGLETTVTVTFEPRDGGTRMTLLHRGLPDDEGGRRHDAGWTSLVSRLEQEFERRGNA